MERGFQGTTSGNPGSTYAGIRPNERQINPHQIEMAKRMIRLDPWLRSVVDIRRDAVFMHGLIVQMQNGQEVTPPPERGLILQRFWIPFLNDCLDALLTIGIIPVTVATATLDTLTDNDRSVPNTAPNDTSAGNTVEMGASYNNSSTAGIRQTPSSTSGSPPTFTNKLGKTVIRYPVVVRGQHVMTTYYDYELKRQQFRFYWLNQFHAPATVTQEQNQVLYNSFGYIDPSVRILHGFGYDPTETGELQSPIASLFEWSERTRKSARVCASAQEIRALPVVFTERPDQFSMRTAQQQETTMMSGMERAVEIGRERLYFDNAETEEVARQDREYARSLRERREWVNQLRRSQTQQRQRMSTLNESAELDETLVPVILPLLSGHKIATRQLPPFNPDYLELNEEWKKQACIALGVPFTMIQEPTRVRSGIQDHTETFKRSTERLRLILSDLATQFYNQVYLDEDFPEIMALYLGEQWMTAPYEQKKRVYFQHLQRLVLPTLPDRHGDDLWILFQRKTISWSEYCTHTRRTSGFPRDEHIEKQELEPSDLRVDQGVTEPAATAGAPRTHSHHGQDDTVPQPKKPKSDTEKEEEEEDEEEPQKKRLKSDKN